VTFGVVKTASPARYRAENLLTIPPAVTVDGMPPADLVRRVVESTGLPAPVAERVITDVIAYFRETTEQFVRRRHGELQRRGKKNAEIWEILAGELAERPVGASGLSERQLRRIVYG
jgi:hypothetical protein